ncbi:hypothetical protein JCM3765_000598 [Sporobolomyces pararoseus]
MRLSEPVRFTLGRYKSKLPILLLLYLLSPPSPSSSSSPSTRNDTTSNSLSIYSSSQNYDESLTLSNPTIKQDNRVVEKDIEVLWTPEFRRGGREQEEEENFRKLKTEKSSPSTSSLSVTSIDSREFSPRTTPELSAPPSPPPQETQRNNPDLEISLVAAKESRPRLRLQPWFSRLSYTLFLFHLILILQLYLKSLKSSISQILLANPLPPPFTTSSSSSSSSSRKSRSSSKSTKISTMKLLSRFKWRFKLLLNRCGLKLIFKILFSGGLIIFLIGKEFLSSNSSDYSSVEAGGGVGGWNRIFLQGTIVKYLSGVVDLIEFTTDDHSNTNNYRINNNGTISERWIKPYRDLILLELFSSFLIFLDCLTPILSSLSIIPNDLFSPKQFLPPPPPSPSPSTSPSQEAQRRQPERLQLLLKVPSNYLLPQYLSFSLTYLSLIQILLLIFSKNLPFTPSPRGTERGGENSGISISKSIISISIVKSVLIFGFSLIQQFGNLLLGREKLEKDFEKIIWLIQMFSKDKIKFSSSTTSSSSLSASESEEESEEEVVREGLEFDGDNRRMRRRRRRRNRRRRRRESLLKEFEKESCCICFEEEWYQEEEADSSGERRGGGGIGSFRSRCFLTNCGHQGLNLQLKLVKHKPVNKVVIKKNKKPFKLVKPKIPEVVPAKQAVVDFT